MREVTAMKRILRGLILALCLAATGCSSSVPPEVAAEDARQAQLRQLFSAVGYVTRASAPAEIRAYVDRANALLAAARPSDQIETQYALYAVALGQAYLGETDAARATIDRLKAMPAEPNLARLGYISGSTLALARTYAKSGNENEARMLVSEAMSPAATSARERAQIEAYGAIAYGDPDYYEAAMTLGEFADPVALQYMDQYIRNMGVIDGASLDQLIDIMTPDIAWLAEHYDDRSLSGQWPTLLAAMKAASDRYPAPANPYQNHMAAVEAYLNRANELDGILPGLAASYRRQASYHLEQEQARLAREAEDAQREAAEAARNQAIFDTLIGTGASIYSTYQNGGSGSYPDDPQAPSSAREPCISTTGATCGWK